MRYLRKYNESSSEFDINFAIAKIKEKWSEEKAASRFDEEIIEWVDPNWEQEYDSEYDWYVDHNNGEAQDVVIDEIIDWYQSEHGSISVDEQIELKKKIQKEYECLWYV